MIKFEVDIERCKHSDVSNMKDPKEGGGGRILNLRKHHQQMAKHFFEANCFLCFIK